MKITLEYDTSDKSSEHLSEVILMVTGYLNAVGYSNGAIADGFMMWLGETIPDYFEEGE